MGSPTVSVVLTTCGRWPLLKDAIKSVFDQGVAELELLLVCDCHAHSFEEYARRVSDMTGGVTLLKYDQEEEGAGYKVKRVSRMVNMGLDHASADFVAFLCDDDVYLRGHLSRMLALAEAGAGWVVDKVQWVRADGSRRRQEALGDFVYPEPHEENHDDLVADISANGTNWICHDCALHRRNEARWEDDDDPAKAPVDWRYWCRLYGEGLRPVTISSPGAEALMPGSWRSGQMTIGAAQAARWRGGMEMSGESEKVVRYAVNVGADGERPKVEVVMLPNGRSLDVGPFGKVNAKLVTTPDGQLFPAFVMEGILRAPRVKELSPEASEPTLATTESVEDGKEIGVTPAPEIEGPLVTIDAPEVKKGPTGSSKPGPKRGLPKLEAPSPKKKGKPAGEAVTREKLEAMFKTELLDEVKKLKKAGKLKDSKRVTMRTSKADMVEAILSVG